MEVFDGNSLRSGLYTLSLLGWFTAPPEPDQGLFRSGSWHDSTRGWPAQKVACGCWRHLPTRQKMLKAAGIRLLQRCVTNRIWPSVGFLLHTHNIYLTFALMHSHRCKKLIRLLSCYGNKHTNPGFAAIHPFVALCYLLNKNVFIYEIMLYLNIYT